MTMSSGTTISTKSELRLVGELADLLLQVRDVVKKEGIEDLTCIGFRDGKTWPGNSYSSSGKSVANVNVMES